MLRHFFGLLRGIEARVAANESDGPNAGAQDNQNSVLEAARRAVAAALARNSVEIDRCRQLRNRISELDAQFLQALEDGDAETARQTAGELAALESQRAACDAAQKSLHAEIDRLKRALAGNASNGGGERMEAAA